MRDLLVEMRGYLDSGDLLTYSDTNSKLHAKVTHNLPQPDRGPANRELRAQLVRFQYRTVLVVGRAKNSIAEHTEIVEAIAAHDPERAGTAMRVRPLSARRRDVEGHHGARSQHSSRWRGTEP